MPNECGGSECRLIIEDAFDRLRREFVEKHSENQREIRRFEDGQEQLGKEVHELKGRITPYLDSGQPGIFSKMSEKLDAALAEIAKLRVDLATEAGRRDVYDIVRQMAGPLAVGLVLVLAQHFWR